MKQPDPTVLKKIKARFAVELHPSKLENVTEGVRQQLNASLLRWGYTPWAIAALLQMLLLLPLFMPPSKFR
jgi:hypothetical protein